MRARDDDELDIPVFLEEEIKIKLSKKTYLFVEIRFYLLTIKMTKFKINVL